MSRKLVKNRSEKKNKNTNDGLNKQSWIPQHLRLKEQYKQSFADIANDESLNVMSVNVILTFDVKDRDRDTQEMFDLRLPVSKNEVGAAEFLDATFFKRVVEKCQELDRDVAYLWKISTASNWQVFKKITGLPSLRELGHNCKWKFGYGFDLSKWEKRLESEYGFGTKADLSEFRNLLSELLRNAPKSPACGCDVCSGRATSN